MAAVQIIRELVVRMLANLRVGVTLGQETLDCFSSVLGQVSHCLLLSRLSFQVGLRLELRGGDVRHREVVSKVTFRGGDNTQELAPYLVGSRYFSRGLTYRRAIGEPFHHLPVLLNSLVDAVVAG